MLQKRKSILHKICNMPDSVSQAGSVSKITQHGDREHCLDTYMASILVCLYYAIGEQTPEQNGIHSVRL